MHTHNSLSLIRIELGPDSLIMFYSIAKTKTINHVIPNGNFCSGSNAGSCHISRNRCNPRYLKIETINENDQIAIWWQHFFI